MTYTNSTSIITIEGDFFYRDYPICGSFQGLALVVTADANDDYEC